MIFLLSSLAALIPIVVYILFLRWLDRYEREPFKTVFLTFLLGATISIGMSFVANTFVAVISKLVMTQAGSEYFVASLVAPMVEEANKGLIVLLFAWLSREFDNVTDGLLYGAVVGLGFAFSENIYYFINLYQAQGEFVWLKSLYVRGLFTAGVHACATALFGAALAYSRYSRWSEKIVSVFIGWALAVMVHSFWNSLLTEASLSRDMVLMLVPYLGLPFIFLLLFIFFQISLLQESRMIEEELSAEAKEGVLPPEHVKILNSYLARGKSGWCPPSVPREDYVSASTELAFLRQRYWKTPLAKRGRFDKELTQLREKIRSWFAPGNGQKGSLSVSIIVVMALIGFLAGFIYFGSSLWQTMLKQFPATTVAKTCLLNHPQIKEHLGEGISFEPKLSGIFTYGPSGGQGDLKIRVHGDKGGGLAHLFFTNEAEGEPWKIDQVFLQVNREKESPIDDPAQWYAEASSLIDLRQWDEAKALCELMKQAVPDDDRGIYCFADLARVQGDVSRFLSLRQNVAEKNPNYYQRQNQLAYAYYVAGELDKSIEHYHRSWDLFPDPLVAVDIGGIYLAQKKNEEGFVWLEKARDKKIKSMHLEYNYGEFYFNKENYPQAALYFEKALYLNADDSLPYFGLALTNWRQGENRKAAYYFEQGILRMPTDSLEHRKNLVDLLIEMKYFDDAIYHLWKVTDYHPQEVWAYVLLAKIFERQGRKAEASFVMGKAKEINSEEAEKFSASFDYIRSL